MEGKNKEIKKKKKVGARVWRKWKGKRGKKEKKKEKKVRVRVWRRKKEGKKEEGNMDKKIK